MLMRAVSNQMRVIFALIMREMTTRYGRSFGGYVWAVLEPASFIVLLSLIFSAISRRPPLGEDFPLFYATGYLAFHFYADVSSTVSSSLQFNKALFTFPKVSLIDAVLARFFLQTVTCIFVTVLLLTPLLILTDTAIILRFGRILTAISLAAMLGLGVGALNSVLFTYFPTWQRFFGLMNRPLFLISGVFFTYESMPLMIREFLFWNPLVHVTALMRSGFYPGYEPDFVSIPYILLFGLPPLMAGFFLLYTLGKGILESV
jgi:capsular polysaccharide transport system permease protein